MLKLLKRIRKPTAREELRDLLGEETLPSFPAVVLQALQQVRSNDTSSQEISETVSADPGLTVKLIGVVNSSAYSLRYPVKNIHHAVALLGRSDLEAVLISMAVRKALPRPGGKGFMQKRFWATAARRASAARALATRIDPSTESECFTAALLQDMALPVLLQRRGEEYGNLLESWHGGEPDLATLERDQYGWDHARVGMLMAAEWQFPQSLVGAIAAHHGPVDDQAGLAAVNLVAGLREEGEETGIDEIAERAVEHHGLPTVETQQLLEQAFADADGIARLFA